MDSYLLLFVCFSKNESAGIAASIDAMAAGEDVQEVSGNGSKNAADESTSVRQQFSSLYVYNMLAFHDTFLVAKQ